jgi:hypothetical protein
MWYWDPGYDHMVASSSAGLGRNQLLQQGSYYGGGGFWDNPWAKIYSFF